MLEMKIISIIFVILCITIPTFANANEVEKAAATLGLKHPVTFEISNYYADGGTIGMTIIGSEGKTLQLSYDGRQREREKLFFSQYHIYFGALHPSHKGAVRIPICSSEETASYLISKRLDREKLSRGLG